MDVFKGATLYYLQMEYWFQVCWNPLVPQMVVSLLVLFDVPLLEKLKKERHTET